MAWPQVAEIAAAMDENGADRNGFFEILLRPGIVGANVGRRPAQLLLLPIPSDSLAARYLLRTATSNSACHLLFYIRQQSVSGQFPAAHYNLALILYPGVGF